MFPTLHLLERVYWSLERTYRCAADFMQELHEVDARDPDSYIPLLHSAQCVATRLADTVIYADQQLLDLAGGVYPFDSPPILGPDGRPCQSALHLAVDRLVFEVEFLGSLSLAGAFSLPQIFGAIRDAERLAAGCPPPRDRWTVHPYAIRIGHEMFSAALIDTPYRIRHLRWLTQRTVFPDFVYLQALTQREFLKLKPSVTVQQSEEIDQQVGIHKVAGYSIAELKDEAREALGRVKRMDAKTWRKIYTESGLPPYGTGGTAGSHRFSNHQIRRLADAAERCAHRSTERVLGGEKIAAAWRALIARE